jgi:hypothetical protein
MSIRGVTMLALAVPVATPAFAQQMDPIWLGHGAIAQSNMNNARANTRRAAGIKDRQQVAEDDPTCRSPLTAAKRQSIHRGRTMLQGKAKADAWLKTECGG